MRLDTLEKADRLYPDMRTYYDDNFGTWTGMDEPEMRDFYHKCQRTNVTKVCSRCERTVRIQPQYSICNDCADAIEKGYDY